MRIGHLDFKHFVFGQAGVQGFFGEEDEHRHHKFFRFIPGFSFKDMVFVAKTITIEPRIYPESSNTELRDGYKVKRFFPKSIWVSLYSFIRGYMMNAVGLANLGANKMFSYLKWQLRTEPFMLSFMPVGKTFAERLEEARNFCELIITYCGKSGLNFALQINFSCPNTGHNQKQDPSEIIEILQLFREMVPGLILIPKFNLLIEPEAIVKIKPYCDAFCLANSLSFGEGASSEFWDDLFPKRKSPLQKYFNGKFKGGLSGAPLFKLLVSWLQRMEELDDSVIILAGGGIMKKRDIARLAKFKIVQGIALGAVATLRPWRLRSLIKYGNEVFDECFD